MQYTGLASVGAVTQPARQLSATCALQIIISTYASGLPNCKRAAATRLTYAGWPLQSCYGISPVSNSNH